MENFEEYEIDIRKNYLEVYFNGGLTRLVEKGETIKIDSMEFFVNDCLCFLYVRGYGNPFV